MLPAQVWALRESQSEDKTVLQELQDALQAAAGTLSPASPAVAGYPAQAGLEQLIGSPKHRLAVGQQLVQLYHKALERSAVTVSQGDIKDQPVVPGGIYLAQRWFEHSSGFENPHRTETPVALRALNRNPAHPPFVPVGAREAVLMPWDSANPTFLGSYNHITCVCVLARGVDSSDQEVLIQWHYYWSAPYSPPSAWLGPEYREQREKSYRPQEAVERLKQDIPELLGFWPELSQVQLFISSQEDVAARMDPEGLQDLWSAQGVQAVAVLPRYTGERYPNGVHLSTITDNQGIGLFIESNPFREDSPIALRNNPKAIAADQERLILLPWEFETGLLPRLDLPSQMAGLEEVSLADHVVQFHGFLSGEDWERSGTMSGQLSRRVERFTQDVLSSGQTGLTETELLQLDLALQRFQALGPEAGPSGAQERWLLRQWQADAVLLLTMTGQLTEAAAAGFLEDPEALHGNVWAFLAEYWGFMAGANRLGVLGLYDIQRQHGLEPFPGDDPWMPWLEAIFLLQWTTPPERFSSPSIEPGLVLEELPITILASGMHQFGPVAQRPVSPEQLRAPFRDFVQQIAAQMEPERFRLARDFLLRRDAAVVNLSGVYHRLHTGLVDTVGQAVGAETLERIVQLRYQAVTQIDSTHQLFQPQLRTGGLEEASELARAERVVGDLAEWIDTRIRPEFFGLKDLLPGSIFRITPRWGEGPIGGEQAYYQAELAGFTRSFLEQSSVPTNGCDCRDISLLIARRAREQLTAADVLGAVIEIRAAPIGTWAQDTYVEIRLRDKSWILSGTPGVATLGADYEQPLAIVPEREWNQMTFSVPIRFSGWEGELLPMAWIPLENAPNHAIRVSAGFDPGNARFDMTASLPEVPDPQLVYRYNFLAPVVFSYNVTLEQLNPPRTLYSRQVNLQVNKFHLRAIREGLQEGWRDQIIQELRSQFPRQEAQPVVTIHHQLWGTPDNELLDSLHRQIARLNEVFDLNQSILYDLMAALQMDPQSWPREWDPGVLPGTGLEELQDLASAETTNSLDLPPAVASFAQRAPIGGLEEAGILFQYSGEVVDSDGPQEETARGFGSLGLDAWMPEVTALQAATLSAYAHRSYGGSAHGLPTIEWEGTMPNIRSFTRWITRSDIAALINRIYDLQRLLGGASSELVYKQLEEEFEREVIGGDDRLQYATQSETDAVVDFSYGYPALSRDQILKEHHFWRTTFRKLIWNVEAHLRSRSLAAVGLWPHQAEFYQRVINGTDWEIPFSSIPTSGLSLRFADLHLRLTSFQGSSGLNGWRVLDPSSGRAYFDSERDGAHLLIGRDFTGDSLSASDRLENTHAILSQQVGDQQGVTPAVVLYAMKGDWGTFFERPISSAAPSDLQLRLSEAELLSTQGHPAKAAVIVTGVVQAAASRPPKLAFSWPKAGWLLDKTRKQLVASGAYDRLRNREQSLWVDLIKILEKEPELRDAQTVPGYQLWLDANIERSLAAYMLDYEERFKLSLSEAIFQAFLDSSGSQGGLEEAVLAEGLDELDQILSRWAGRSLQEDQKSILLLGPDALTAHEREWMGLIPRLPQALAGRLAFLTDPETARNLQSQLDQGRAGPEIFSHPVDAAMLLPEGLVQYVGSTENPVWGQFRALRPRSVVLPVMKISRLLERLLANLRGVPVSALTGAEKEEALRIAQILIYFK